MDFRAGEKTRDGYLAVPASGNGPGVLLLHAWWGLSPFFIGLCDRLAGAGFVVCAPDLFHGEVADTIPEAEKLVRTHEADEEAMGALVRNALDVFTGHPGVRPGGVAALGFSMGAWWALHVAERRPDAVAATVLFYGVGEADFGASRCVYQLHFAEHDTFDSVEDAEAMAAAMRAAGRDVELYVYPGAGHWFLEDNRPETYNAPAATMAWDRAVAFLNAHLRPAGTAS